jgi:flavorubredoxin
MYILPAVPNAALLNNHTLLLLLLLLSQYFDLLQLALGSILREAKARELPCGVFGSFGWSGEAVDEMEAKLKDAGYGFAFKPIKVKFKPTATVRKCRHAS